MLAVLDLPEAEQQMNEGRRASGWKDTRGREARSRGLEIPGFMVFCTSRFDLFYWLCIDVSTIYLI